MTTVAPHMEGFLRPTRWSVTCSGKKVNAEITGEVHVNWDETRPLPEGTVIDAEMYAHVPCTYAATDSSLLWAVRQARGHLARTGHTRLVIDVAETEDVTLPDGSRG